MDEIQTLVIGAGVVGLAIARTLARSGREVLIAEKEALIGSGASARNSEVIHAGIYYPKGSLKAVACVEGRNRLYDYCASRKVPHAKCGKLIVATEPDEGEKLAGILARAQANGVGDARLIPAEDARAREPGLRTAGAILSPSTGIIDSHAFMLSLLGEAEEGGAMLALNTPVERIGAGHVVHFGGEHPMKLKAREVINAAAHGAPAVSAAMEELPPAYAPRHQFARGVYFSLTGKAPFSRLIYPAPVPGGLGVHLTLDMAGRAKFGPDVEWIEEEDYTVDPARGDGFYAAIRRYWPDLPDGALQPDYAGIRPKLVGPGEPDADFWVKGPRDHGVAGYVGLAGIESPGLTASLALAAHVRALLDAG